MSREGRGFIRLAPEPRVAPLPDGDAISAAQTAFSESSLQRAGRIHQGASLVPRRPRPGDDHETNAWWVSNRPLFAWMKPYSDEERNRG